MEENIWIIQWYKTKQRRVWKTFWTKGLRNVSKLTFEGYKSFRWNVGHVWDSALVTRAYLQ